MRMFLSAGKRIYFTLLASSFMFPVSAFAQCVDNEDCVSLGYNKTSCKTPGLKCPFGEYYYCPKDCEDGYEWKDGACQPEEPEATVLGQCTGYAKNCNIADILYSDGTCSTDVVSGKTPIGVVVYIGSDNCGQALALEGLGNFSWPAEYVDIPNLPNYENEPLNDFSSCENTKTVIDYSYNQYGERASEYYPGFWKVYNYAPSTIPETKGKWCLPAGGVLNSIYRNKAAINQSLTKINKENINNDLHPLLLSSSESDNGLIWTWEITSGNFSCSYNTTYEYIISRPVITF